MLRRDGLSSTAPLYITGLRKKAFVPRLRTAVPQLGQGHGSWSPSALSESSYAI